MKKLLALLAALALIAAACGDDDSESTDDTTVESSEDEDAGEGDGDEDAVPGRRVALRRAEQSRSTADNRETSRHAVRPSRLPGGLQD